jgi:uncharacterized membrane protein YhhN
MGFLSRKRAQQGALALVMPALAARTATGPRGLGLRRVIAAQGLSWGGDLALMGPGRGRFLTGLTSFLGAHVAYASALRARSSEPLLGTPGRRRFLAAGAAAASGMALAAAREDRAVALPIAGYGLTLVTMVAAAAAVDPDRGRGRLLTGASLFLVSDTLIGVRRFVLPDRAAGLDTAVLATYVAAQWCLADGMKR